jgi:hypothetical protein
MLLKFLIIATILVAFVYTQAEDSDRMKDMMLMMRNATHLMDRLQRGTTEAIDTEEYYDDTRH